MITWIQLEIMATIAFVFLGGLYLTTGFHNIDLAYNMERAGNIFSFGLENLCDMNVLGTACLNYTDVYLNGVRAIFVGSVFILIGGISAGLSLNSLKINKKYGE